MSGTPHDRVKKSIIGPNGYLYRASPFGPWSSGSWSLTSTSSMTGSNSGLPINTNSDDGNAWFQTRSVETIAGGTRSSSKYQGVCTCGDPIGTGWNYTTLPVQMSDTNLKTNGTTLESRCTPNNPAFSVPAFLGETLQDGAPHAFGYDAWKERTHIARGAGNEYLNAEFGWVPFVSDLTHFGKAVRNSHTIWSSYLKGSGSKTRVGHSLPSTSTSVSYNGNMSALPSAAGSGPGGFVSSNSTHCWFKGAFRYFVPQPKGLVGKMQYYDSQAARLLGVRLTPDTVWQLAPWSWALDWFTNTGDVMSLISDLGQDSLVLQYGYAMAEQVNIISRFAAIGVGDSSTSPTPVSRITEQTRRRRLPAASPYGFQVALSSLSVTQKAIIVALGLSHA